MRESGNFTKYLEVLDAINQRGATTGFLSSDPLEFTFFAPTDDAYTTLEIERLQIPIEQALQIPVLAEMIEESGRRQVTYGQWDSTVLANANGQLSLTSINEDQLFVSTAAADVTVAEKSSATLWDIPVVITVSDGINYATTVSIEEGFCGGGVVYVIDRVLF